MRSDAHAPADRRPSACRARAARTGRRSLCRRRRPCPARRDGRSTHSRTVEVVVVEAADACRGLTRSRPGRRHRARRALAVKCASDALRRGNRISLRRSPLDDRLHRRILAARRDAAADCCAGDCWAHIARRAARHAVSKWAIRVRRGGRAARAGWPRLFSSRRTSLPSTRPTIAPESGRGASEDLLGIDIRARRGRAPSTSI